MNQEALNFVESCKTINKSLALVTEKEVVPAELAFASEVIVKNMDIKDVGDALIFAGAINLLNTFVKQDKENKKALGYSFKKGVNFLLKFICSNPNEMIKAEIQKDRDMSLCLLEINSIQFSFHNIDLNTENRKLIAKNLDHPEMKWDGIRKQMCSVTLFNFAKDNTYGKTGKMMDGSDFSEGLNSLMQDYRDGTKTLEDSKKVYFGKNRKLTKKTTGSGTSQGAEKEYPNRKRLTMILYQNNVQGFVEDIESRRIFDLLFKAYEDNYGFMLSSIRKFEWKFAIESLTGIFKAADVSPEAGVGFFHYRSYGGDFPALCIVSEGSDKIKNVAIIQLFSWDQMVLTEEGAVFYTNAETVEPQRSRHPSEIVQLEQKGISLYLSGQGKIEFYPCTYFANAPFGDSANITSTADQSMLKKYPVFYAEDRAALADFIGKALRGENGAGILDEIGQNWKEVNPYDLGKINSEFRLILEVIKEDIVLENQKKLYLLNMRRSAGESRCGEYISEYFKENIQIFDGQLPETTDELAASKNILLCDLDLLGEDKYEGVKELEVDCVQQGILFEQFDLTMAEGFWDRGCGLNLITTRLGIGIDKQLPYFGGFYPITVVNSESEFTDSPGVANVIIPADIKYDQIEDTVEASPESLLMVYRELLKGSKGLNLLFKNVPLSNYFYNILYNLKDQIRNITGKDNPDMEDLGQLLEFTKTFLQNPGEYSRYVMKVQKCIGINAWFQLTENSRSWVVTSMCGYSTAITSSNAYDYSGPVLLMSKAFETELYQRFGLNYLEYMHTKYGEEYVDKLPDALVKEVDEIRKPVSEAFVTLGSIPFIMGLNPKGEVMNQREYDEFSAYAREILFADPEKIDADIKELLEIVYYVRVNFRNTSAHKTNINQLIATDCIEYCITKKRKLGVMMDMFAK